MLSNDTSCVFAGSAGVTNTRGHTYHAVTVPLCGRGGAQAPPNRLGLQIYLPPKLWLGPKFRHSSDPTRPL